MYHSLFIHSPTEGHFGCFQVLALMNKAAINIRVKVFLQTCFQFIRINTNGCHLDYVVRVRLVS